MHALLNVAAIVGAVSVAVILLGMAADVALCAWEDTRWQREQSRRHNTHADTQGRR